ncbi:hypothetical protein SPONL_1421 [uncultured Candidatus Thioglobus sp.]|nr:hypothetical protein SPONL_1421 [uncultured Candidatus Thioglobus sp.]
MQIIAVEVSPFHLLPVLGGLMSQGELIADGRSLIPWQYP